MAASPTPSLAFPVRPPSTAEAAALAVVARYFGRAGTQAATLLLGDAVDPKEAALLGDLRDQLLAGAALCEGLLALADEGYGS